MTDAIQLPVADELRGAAQLMRERARAATPGPWHTGDRHPTMADTLHPHEVVISLRHPLVELEPDRNGSNDAAHIAAWHPDVALAVADWLDIGANPYACVDRGPMLAVARAYLGGEAR